MQIWTILHQLFGPRVSGYNSADVRKLQEGITGYHEAFTSLNMNPFFLMNSSLTTFGMTDPNVFQEDRKGMQITDEYAHKTCEWIDAYNEFQDTVVCPWYYRMTVDEKRIPKILMEAMCKCPSCSEGMCVRYIVNIPVLRKYRNEFKPTLEPFSVACVCKKVQRETDPLVNRKGAQRKAVQPELRSMYERKRRKRRKRKKIKTKNPERRLKWWIRKKCVYYRYC